MLQIILSSVLIMSASLLGVFSVWKYFGNFIQKNLRFLVSLSAGVILFISYHLGYESIEHGDNSIPWIIIGFLIMIVIFKFIPSFHHHHDENEDDHSHDKLDARRILLGDAIHNIADGVLLVTSFSISTQVGIITTLAIFLHEAVQEISEFFVLKEAGYSTKKALKVNFLVSSTILIGSIGSYFLLEIFHELEPILLALSAGSFLVVVILDLIPHSIRTSNTKTQYVKHISFFILGILIMFGLGSITEEGHDHDHDIHEEEDHNQ